MNKKYNIYRIVEKTKEYLVYQSKNKTYHKLLLLKTCDTLEEAEQWLAENNDAMRD